MGSGAAFCGSIVDAETGVPIAGFGLRIVNYEKGEARSTSEVSGAVIEPGRYEIPGLSLGVEHAVVVTPKAEDYVPAVLGPVVAREPRHKLDARVLRCAAVAVRVVDAAGQPLFGKPVGVRPHARVPGGPFWGPAPTDREGRREFARLPPGGYEFFVVGDGEKSASVEVDLRPLANEDVKIEMKGR